ncbi:MAG TPA: hypothetical protein DDW65_17420, partial [Firmicutes bacterium]|nr:hypothetical protein [Bacillota bacterium]
KIVMRKEDVSLVNIIDASLKPLWIQLDDGQITLENKTHSKALPMVRVDISRIAWVFSNIVSNAIRYTPEGGCIVIDADVKDAWILVSVKDTGIGIPKEYQTKIFDKFVQIKNNDQYTSGAGLGLAIVRDIIKAHGGKIWVESQLGEGSTFWFTIPVAEN